MIIKKISRLILVVFTISCQPCIFAQAQVNQPSLLTSYTHQLKVAKRIIALSPHAVEMLFAIGAGENIIATTDYADYPNAAKSIPRIGGYYGIQMEKILALQPDLVVVWSGGNKLSDMTKLRSLGINIYDSNPRSLNDIATELLNLGQLTGDQQQAQLVAKQYNEQLTRLRADNLNKPKIKVFYQLWSTPLMTVAKHSWIQQIIHVCHGNNVFFNSGNAYPQISLENVLLTAPQVILQSQDKSNVQGINWQQWQQIPAVNKKQIYQLNADLLHRASPRTILGIKAVCNALDKARMAY